MTKATYRASSSPSSDKAQIMPLDSTPLILLGFISNPPGSIAPGRDTITFILSERVKLIKIREYL